MGWNLDYWLFASHAMSSETRVEPKLLSRSGLELEPELEVSSAMRFSIVKRDKWQIEFVTGTVFERRSINKKIQWH